MKSELYAQIFQNIDSSSLLSESASDETKTGVWKGRTISDIKDIKSQIKRILEPVKDQKVTDKQLFERMCILCDVDAEQEKSLGLLYNNSAKEGTAALTDVLIKIAKKTPVSEIRFYEDLNNWSQQGEAGENRELAAKRIISAYKSKSSVLKLQNLGLKSLPDALKELSPHLKILDLSFNKLETLPDMFEDATNLTYIVLEKNPIEHFPKVLYAVKNKQLNINLNNTPVAKTIITPGIKTKMYNDEWTVTAFSSEKGKPFRAFEKSLKKYNTLLETSKQLGISPVELIQNHRVPQSESLKKETEQTLLQIDNEKKTRVQNLQDFKEKLDSCNLSKARLLNLENSDGKINVFGFGTPYKTFLEEGKSEFDDKTHAMNLPFILNELDTLITLVDRDENNEALTFIKDYAGTKTLHPIQNVFSIPIPDFHPPRLEHYLALAKEMSVSSASEETKGIGIFCGFGEGRTGTLLAAAQIINEFKNLDSEAKNQLLNITRDFTPDTFYGTFTYLNKNFKTTSFVGNIIQKLRQLEKDTNYIKVGLSVETPAQVESLEILQCMLAISEKLKDTPPINDEQILEILNEKNFSPEALEEFFQIDHTQTAGDVILAYVKQLNETLLKNTV